MGDWAHRLGASPLMRMTASWSWSAWTDRIQVRGAMLRARGRVPLRSLRLTPSGAPWRGPHLDFGHFGRVAREAGAGAWIGRAGFCHVPVHRDLQKWLWCALEPSPGNSPRVPARSRLTALRPRRSAFLL